MSAVLHKSTRAHLAPCSAVCVALAIVSVVAACGGGEVLAGAEPGEQNTPSAGDGAVDPDNVDDDNDNGGGGGGGDASPMDDGGVVPPDGEDPVDPTLDPDPPVTVGKRCNLNLHWAGGGGQSDSINLEGVTNVWPTSPGGAFWLYDGPHNMTYDPDTGDADYQALVTFLEGVLANRGCGPTVIVGYSNGGGLATKLYCEGEDFGGRVWGYMVDDPVMDDGARGCAPSSNVRKVLFTHSDELVAAANGANYSCSVTGWYCQDNRTMPLAEFEAEVGQTSVRQRAIHAGGGWADDTYASWAVPARWWAEDFE